MAADMVEMAVAGDGDQRPLPEHSDLAAQADHAHARIEQQITVATAHMPDVAALERLDLRLVVQGDAVREAPRFEPACGSGDAHRGSASQCGRSAFRHSMGARHRPGEGAGDDREAEISRLGP